MTAYPKITLACDESLCFFRFQGAPGQNAQQTRDLAFDSPGWRVIGGKDYCPQHGRQREDEHTPVATYDNWTKAISQLQNYAESLGLEWAGGWGGIPKNSPKIRMNPETEDFYCPHCGKTQGEFLLALDDGSAMLAEWADDHWEAYPDAEEVSWLGAYCAECNGWISPEDEVVLK